MNNPLKLLQKSLFIAGGLLTLAFLGIGGLILIKGIKSKPQSVARMAAPDPRPVPGSIIETTTSGAAPAITVNPSLEALIPASQPAAPGGGLQPQIDSRLFRKFGKTTGVLASDDRIYSALTGKSHGIAGLTAVGWRSDIRRTLAIPGRMTIEQFRRIIKDVKAIEKDHAADANNQFHP